MAAKASKKQLKLDFEGKPAEDVQLIIEFNLLSERGRISEALTGLTHFEGGQKPLHTDLEGVRENQYIKSTDIGEARKRLTELFIDEEIEITEGRHAFSGELQLLIKEKKKPAEGSEQTESARRKSSKPVKRKARDDGRDPDDIYWPQWNK